MNSWASIFLETLKQGLYVMSVVAGASLLLTAMVAILFWLVNPRGTPLRIFLAIVTWVIAWTAVIASALSTMKYLFPDL